MEYEIVQLTAADFEEAMDFLNLVFGAHGPHDFEHMLPAVYQATDEWMACNRAVRENGKIRAIVGMFPIDWQVGEERLRVGGIGGVSTHPRRRGVGYMKALMGRCVQDMRDAGMHLSYLGGQRQRYQYFGYERCGLGVSYTLSRTNLRHCFEDDPGIVFAPLSDQDAARLEAAARLHAGQTMYCRRAPDNFHRYLHSWHAQPHAAMDDRGDMVGYLVAGNGGRVAELVAADDATAFTMLRAWTAACSDSPITIDLPLTGSALARDLELCCERVGLHPTGNWQIFDWQAVLEALLKVQHRCLPLRPGRVTLGVQGYGAVTLEVDAAGARCERTAETPCLEVPALTAMRLLFGPVPAARAVALPPTAALLGQWCPLPLFWPRQDGV